MVEEGMGWARGEGESTHGVLGDITVAEAAAAVILWKWSKRTTGRSYHDVTPGYRMTTIRAEAIWAMLWSRRKVGSIWRSECGRIIWRIRCPPIVAPMTTVGRSAVVR